MTPKKRKEQRLLIATIGAVLTGLISSIAALITAIKS